VSPYLSVSDIFAFPSLGEGMPNALHEAMAAGLPCVALREKLGAAAREDVAARFGLERMVDRYEACYRAATARLPIVSTDEVATGELP
jgi:glycosyltransferase involved in cell wall biosynthesis